MITALVLFGILAVCAFLEWIVMIPLAGRDRMKAWKERYKHYRKVGAYQIHGG